MVSKISVVRFLFIAFACSLAASFISSAPAQAQSVTEAYMEIPDSMIGYSEPPTSAEAKKSAIKTAKDKSGYLITKNGVEFAKFKRKQETPLFVVAGSSYAEDRLARLISAFAKDESGKWEDVTSSYLPKIPDMVVDALFSKKCRSKLRLSDSASGTYRFYLPEKKGPIYIQTESDVSNCRAKLFKLKFDGNRFNMIL